MEYDAVKIWIDVAQFAITGAIGIYIYLVNKNDHTNSRIDEVEKAADVRLDDHAKRIAKMEGGMNHLPTHNDMNQLSDKISGLQAESATQTGLLHRLTQQFDLMNEWLVKRAK